MSREQDLAEQAPAIAADNSELSQAGLSEQSGAMQLDGFSLDLEQSAWRP